MVNRKPRVLCLHGNRQTAGILEQRISDELSKVFELVFLDAPFELEDDVLECCSETVSGETSKSTAVQHQGKLRSWLNDTGAASGSRIYDYAAGVAFEDWFPAFDAIRACWGDDGPFDGVFGFSQGACLAGMFARLGRLRERYCPGLKFIVTCGGMVAKLKEEERFTHRGEEGSSSAVRDLIPVGLHFAGEKDPLVKPEETEALWSTLSGSTSGSSVVSHHVLHYHPAGHIIPAALIRKEIERILKRGGTSDGEQNISAHELVTTEETCIGRDSGERGGESWPTTMQQCELEVLEATFGEDRVSMKSKFPFVVVLKMNFCTLWLTYPPYYAEDESEILAKRQEDAFFVPLEQQLVGADGGDTVADSEDFGGGDFRGGGRVRAKIRYELHTSNFLFELKQGDLMEELGDVEFRGEMGDGVGLGMVATEWEARVSDEKHEILQGGWAGVAAAKEAPGDAASPTTKPADFEELDNEDEGKWWTKAELDRSLLDHVLRIKDVESPETLSAVASLSKAKRGRVWKFVIGLVGKPSAGKSTFFNAVCEKGMAETADHPFTTIEPNIAQAWFEPQGLALDSSSSSGDGDCATMSGVAGGSKSGTTTHNVTVKNKLPCLVKDVAGLVPGAYQGRGKGNAFLNDLLDADALVHVVDLSGRLDEGGYERGGDDVDDASEDSVDKKQALVDIKFIAEEIHCWIFENVRAKWHVVRKLSKGHPKIAVDRFCGLFTGVSY